MKHSYFYVFCLMFITANVNAEDITVASAATQFDKNVKWKNNSIVSGDFSCKGKLEHAILGTNKTEIVVAIFIKGLNKPPEFLRFSGSARDPATSVLTVEEMNYNSKEFIEEVGKLPGFRVTKTCKGLNMSDGNIDSAHIYWNHDANQFTVWVL